MVIISLVILYCHLLIPSLVYVQGLLSLGTPLDWNDAKQLADHIRLNGIKQFLNIWFNVKDKQGEPLLWGDEVSIRFTFAFIKSEFSAY